MKSIFSLLIIVLSINFNHAQSFDDFQITELVKSTPLKNQMSSGTCWSFTTFSFIETEALRLGMDTVIISPIYYVTPTYLGKAQNFIEKKGNSFFNGGDLTFSALDAYAKYGAVPESVYNGIIDGDWQHDHLEIDDLLRRMAISIGKSGYGRIKPNSWKKSIEGVLDAYIGSAPDTFTYEGEKYTPQTFAQKKIGINRADYLEITSFSHLPFYKMTPLNIPANWNNNDYLNLPPNDFEKVIDNAIQSGYSIAWDGDADEARFDYSKGLMLLTQEEEDNAVTQELRQTHFVKGTTTDDHNMHIIGMAKNKAGKDFYLMKNSEGENDMGGYVFMSKKALLLKTISVLMHKDGLTQEVKNALD